MIEATFNIGGLTLGWYGILIAISVLSAIGIALIEAKRRGENTGHITNLALLVIPLVIIVMIYRHKKQYEESK